MAIKKSKNNVTPIKPLFLMVDDSKNIGNHIINFAKDDYNKAIGAALIDAKNDAEAISSFLLEFRDAPLTLISYSKEIERLLLWCIHVAKLNISSLRRNDLMAYQDFLKNPEPQNSWVGANATILPRIKIGMSSAVGAGAVVTRDVPDNAIVVGNPAKILLKTIF